MMKFMLSLHLQGLTVGDEVVEFGSVSTANFKSLHDIGNVVKHSQGVSCLGIQYFKCVF